MKVASTVKGHERRRESPAAAALPAGGGVVKPLEAEDALVQSGSLLQNVTELADVQAPATFSLPSF